MAVCRPRRGVEPDQRQVSAWPFRPSRRRHGVAGGVAAVVRRRNGARQVRGRGDRCPDPAPPPAAAAISRAMSPREQKQDRISPRLEGVEGAGINRHARRLPQRRLRPGKAEPAQILKDSLDERLAAATGVDVLDAQQEGSVRPRLARREQGGQGVPQVQPSGRAGGEAGDLGVGAKDGGHRGSMACPRRARNRWQASQSCDATWWGFCYTEYHMSCPARPQRGLASERGRFR